MISAQNFTPGDYPVLKVEAYAVKQCNKMLLVYTHFSSQNSQKLFYFFGRYTAVSCSPALIAICMQFLESWLWLSLIEKKASFTIKI